MNVRKNRTDIANAYPVAIANVLNLPWPAQIARQQRSQWSAGDASAIARYEGIPVQLEGYLAGAKQQGPESCNCHAVDQSDNHLWIVDAPNKDRSQSVVAEVTPRMRSLHPGWAYSRILPLVNSGIRVRLTGWLLMDQEHPDQIGKTRGTIWELHPITAFEVAQGNTWVALDTGQAVPRSQNSLAPTEDPALPPALVEPTDQQSQRATPLARRRSGTAEGHPLFSGAVAIIDIHTRGAAKPNEPDEYVEIANTGDAPVDMSGWILRNVYGGEEFRWTNFSLQGRHNIRVYTNQVHPETGGFSLNASHEIWKNGGDTAELLDRSGTVVATYSYGDKR
ncbi:MAG: hypothetical protein NVSMB42_13350 [Herpetosiphon sp.]